MIKESLIGVDNNWIVTGFDNALEAKRRVEALCRRVPASNASA